MDEEILKEFLVESTEILDQLDKDFVELEQRPQDKDLLGAIFRAVHTIKGTCGFFGFSQLESMTHAGENLLDKLRNGEMELTEDMTGVLLKVCDQSRIALAAIQSRGTDEDMDFSAVVAEIEAVQGIGVAPADAGESAASEPAAEAAELSGEDSTVHMAPGDVLQLQPAAPAASAPAPSPPAPAASKPAAAAAPADSELAAVTDPTVRVHVGLLDALMNLVGELVLTRNQILQFATNHDDSGFVATTQRLNLITSELQEGVMKTRMQPIGNLWRKLPRVVRDVAKVCNKRTRLEMVGRETELDRTLLEAIRDPLVHLVRNSIDHGLEKEADRVAAGKDPEGLVTLRAYHEGGLVNVEIIDDGAGVNVEKLKDKAVASGLITREAADRLGHREALQLMFRPGLSTAKEVTNVSGRGVGMDVVKTNIERIGGSIDVLSEQGKGTTFRLKIPLTLAIIPALIVRSGTERFAIPQVSLIELVRLDGGDRSRVEMVHDTPVYRLRGRLLPLVDLAELLDIRREGDVPSTSGERHDEDGEGAVYVIVVRADDREFGLVVDAVGDTQEIVVKPVGPQLKWLRVFAGATIMGDGKVALILDGLGIAQETGVVSEARNQLMAERAAAQVDRNGVVGERRTLLVCRTPDDGRMAVPLGNVARLEELPSADIEHVGGRGFIQYRGDILPVIRLSEFLQERRAVPRTDGGVPPETVSVVVCTKNGEQAGLVVDEVMDIVDECIGGLRPASRPGVSGVAVVAGRITELLDIDSVMDRMAGTPSETWVPNYAG